MSGFTELCNRADCAVTILQQWDCLQGSALVAGGPTLPSAPANTRKLAEIVHFLTSNNDQTNYLINPLSITLVTLLPLRYKVPEEVI